jgi:hypothetical protein
LGSTGGDDLKRLSCLQFSLLVRQQGYEVATSKALLTDRCCALTANGDGGIHDSIGLCSRFRKARHEHTDLKRTCESSIASSSHRFVISLHIRINNVPWLEDLDLENLQAKFGKRANHEDLSPIQGNTAKSATFRAIGNLGASKITRPLSLACGCNRRATLGHDPCHRNIKSSG